MQEVDFRTEVKKHILVQKSLDASIVEADKQELAKELECSTDDCIFLDNSVSALRRYGVGTNLYTVDRIKNIEKIATFDKSKVR